MHLEVLVEDTSSKIVLEAVLGRIVSSGETDCTYRILSYKGLGRIPRNLRGVADPGKRLILNRLPMLLKGYGKSLQHFPAAVVVLVDLDNRSCVDFKQEMLDVLESCNPRPTALFRIAIEELEAWLLGDRKAVKAAYPRAKDAILDSYAQDSICGTWETLADAVYPGGCQRLKQVGYPEVGRVKGEWARKIGAHLDPEANLSKSFQVFRDGIRSVARSGI